MVIVPLCMIGIKSVLLIAAAKYHTSKLREFSDLECVPTFGFRGEALSSLCSVSQMTIVTKHKSSNWGTKLEVDHDGRITKKSPCARQTGTSVTIQNLFAKLPVRKIEFKRNIKKEYAKMCTIVQAYGIVSEGVRIICSNVNEKGVKSIVVSTNGGTMQDNILSVFGTKQTADLVPIKSMSIGSPSEDSLNTTEIREELSQLTDNGVDVLNMSKIKLIGFVSSCEHGKGRSSKDRQFFYVNKRPCEPKSIQKLVNEVYKKYNVNQNPFVSLNIEIDRTEVDVNLTPDKRQVLINNETVLLLAIKIALIRTFEGMVGSYRIQNNISLILNNSSPRTEKSESPVENEDVDSDGPEDTPEVPKTSKLQFSKMLTQWKQTGDTARPSSSQRLPSTGKRKQDSISKFSSKMRKIQEALDADTENSSKSLKSHQSITSLSDDEGEQDVDLDSSQRRSVSEPPTQQSPENTQSPVSTSISCPVEKPVIIFEEKSSQETPSTPVRKSTSLKDYLTRKSKIDCVVDSPKAVRIIEDIPENRTPAQNVAKLTMQLKRTKIKLSMNLDEIKKAIVKEDELLEESQVIASSLSRLKFKSKITPASNKKAEEELSREITKSSFRAMEVLGQFNLGFIVVRLNDDLFIIDQHASDEKYNFETLQKTTVLQNQKLVIPQQLDLSAPKEIILMDNLKVFKMNGFSFLIDDDAPHTKKVKLLTKPFSQNWEFGTEDIDEILFMLEDAPGNTLTCRPSRVRAMFASRACRKSVMIGTALNLRDMQRIVNHMGEMDHPWVSYTNYSSVIKSDLFYSLFVNKQYFIVSSTVPTVGPPCGTW